MCENKGIKIFRTVIGLGLYCSKLSDWPATITTSCCYNVA